MTIDQAAAEIDRRTDQPARQAPGQASNLPFSEEAVAADTAAEAAEAAGAFEPAEAAPLALPAAAAAAAALAFAAAAGRC